MAREHLATFWVPGEPVSKERPRHGRGRTYTPKKTLEAENLIRWHFIRKKPAGYQPEPGYVYAVMLGFYLAGSNAKDIDNMEKTVLDALNKFAWEDDRHIVEVAKLRYYDKKRKPGTSIEIYRMEKKNWEKSATKRYDSLSKIMSSSS